MSYKLSSLWCRVVWRLRCAIKFLGLGLVLVLFIKDSSLQFKFSIYAYNTAHYFLHVELYRYCALYSSCVPWCHCFYKGALLYFANTKSLSTPSLMCALWPWRHMKMPPWLMILCTEQRLLEYSTWSSQISAGARTWQWHWFTLKVESYELNE